MLSAYCTDVGNVKKVNQDALLIMEAALDSGSLMFAAVCDGMGGLLNGEHASTVLTDALGKWFREEAVLSAASGMTRREMIDSLNRTILSVDSSLYSYSRSKGDCGTTLTGLILCRGRYLCVNVGDSRAYRMNSGGITQITRDQTVVQQRLDRGEISEKEAKTHPDQSVLLQCVGAGKEVVPDYTWGTYDDADLFLLCSDGFRHKVTGKEIYKALYPSVQMTEEGMGRLLRDMTEKIKARKERDNLTAILIAAKE